MKILFLANRIPFPPFRGDKLKILNLTTRLAKKHTLYLITFYQDKDELKYVGELKKIFDEVYLIYLPKWQSIFNCVQAIFRNESFQLAYFRSSKMRRVIRHFLVTQNVDVTHVQHLRMSQYADLLPQPKILDLPDAYSLYWKRRKSVKRNLYNRLFDSIESRRVITAEKVIFKFDMNLVCSVEDREYLMHEHATDKIELLRNGVDIGLFTGKGDNYSEHSTLLFTGNMDYAPNVDAVVYFKQQIWPVLKNKFPELKWIIAGQRPVKAVLDLADMDITVTGFVPNMAEMYEKAAIVIAPLRFGAGTQNKVLEAMAMGVPVVCTEIGFKGLEIESGQGCFLSLSDADFVANVTALLNSGDLRRKTGREGFRIAREKFSWESITAQLETYFNELADHE